MGGPTRRCTRRAAVRWPGASAPRFSATRCVALLEPKGRAPGEFQVRWPDRSLNFLIRGDRVEVLPAAPLPPAGCTFGVARISVCASGVREGARSRRLGGAALARATLP